MDCAVSTPFYGGACNVARQKKEEEAIFMITPAQIIRLKCKMNSIYINYYL
jgi:hypothetical protein